MSLAGDDASTRALAGSILSYKDCVSSAAVTPVEVHVDAQTSPDEIHLRQTVDEAVQHENYLHASEAHPPYYKIPITAPTRGWWSSKSSETSGRKQDRDYLVRHDSLRNGKDSVVVSFIDEPPNYEGSTSANAYYLPVEERDENRYYRPVAPTREVADCGSSSDCCSRKISMFESKSLDHLIGYCELCQKIHRPCCPNAHSRHVVGALRAPEEDVCNGNCADTLSLKYHGSNRNAVETCAKSSERRPGAMQSYATDYYYENEEDRFGHEDAVGPHLHHKRGVPHSMHRRSTPAISEVARRHKSGGARPQSLPCHPPLGSRTDLTSSVDDIQITDYQEMESL